MNNKKPVVCGLGAIAGMLSTLEINESNGK